MTAPAPLGERTRQAIGDRQDTVATGLAMMASRTAASTGPGHTRRGAAGLDTGVTRVTDPGAGGSPDRICAAVAHLIGEDRPEQRQALQTCLKQRLEGVIDARCRSLAVSRLRTTPLPVREALLEARTGRAQATDRLLTTLPPASAIRVLGNGPGRGNRWPREAPPIEDLLARAEPELREAVLDLLCEGGSTRRLMIDGLDQQCLMVLQAGLAALGLESTRLAEGAEPEPTLEEASGESGFRQALRRGAEKLAIRHLARAAIVDPALVEQAVRQRDSRALVSLAWKAGYSMKAAVGLQTDLAGIPPHRVSMALENGLCPLSRGEMAWQLREMGVRIK